MVNIIETIVHNRPQREAALAALEQSPSYKDSVALHMLQAQRAHPFLGQDLGAVLTDYDKSLNMNRVGDSSDTLEFMDYTDGYDVPIAAITGSDFLMMQEKMVRFGMGDRRPPILCTDVGNEIWVLGEDGDYHTDADWDKKMEEEKGFTYEAMYQLCVQAVAQINAEFAAQGIELGMHFQELYSAANVLHHRPELAGVIPPVEIPVDFTPTKAQPGRYKISFHYLVDPADLSVTDRVYERLSALIHEHAPEVRTSTSSADEERDGKHLYNFDVCAVIKDETVTYLAEKLGAVVGVWGDSGNDISMLRDAQHPNIGMRGIVGGYKAELGRAIDAIPTQMPCGNNFRVADDGRVFYVETDAERKGPRSMLQSVREARVHYLRATKKAA